MPPTIGQRDLKTGSHLATTWHLAWPIILENALTTTFGLVDTAMVGSLGAVSISAIALNSSIIYMVHGFLIAVSVGSTVMVAQAIGAGNPEKAARIGRQSLILGLLFGLIVFLPLMLISGSLPGWMGGRPEVQGLATVYLRWVVLSFPLYYPGLVLAAVLRGFGDTRTPLRIAITGNLLNVVGNFLLIFPTRAITVYSISFLMPGAGLGVAGAAISTAVTQGLTGILLLIVFLTRRFPMQFLRHQTFRLHLPDLRQIFKIGIPSALDRSSHTIGLLIYVRIIAGLGTTALAAHQLASAAESISYMPIIGFSIAATTLVGQSIGARRTSDAWSYSRICVICGLMIMSTMAAVLFLFPAQLIALFTSDPDVIQLAVTTLRAYVWALPFFAVSIVSVGAMRGAGDTRVPFYYAMTGMWLLRLPLALLAVLVFNLGLPAVWIAMGVDLTFRGITMGRRLLRKAWLDAATMGFS
jgi:putative MATE family efflux protein